VAFRNLRRILGLLRHLSETQDSQCPNTDRTSRQKGNLQAALDDLAAVNPDSPDYKKAQSLTYEIQIQQKYQNYSPHKVEQETPQEIPHTEAAKRACKEMVKDREEFPSTIEFKWFGTDSTVGPPLLLY
jgi:hypothetical protein